MRESNLVRLDLSYNSIRLKGGQSILQGIKDNSTLQSINLSWNGLGSESCRWIAESIANSESEIEEFYLEHNQLDSSLLVPLSKALKENTRLKILDLSYNYLGKQLQVHLIEAMKVNRSLRELNLQHTDIIASEPLKYNIERLDEDDRI